jgi:membrane protease YdiL (CAAX protease family)
MADASPSPAAPPRLADRVALACALALPSLITWAYFFRADAAPPGIQLLVYNAAKATQFAFPIAWLAWSHPDRLRRDRPARSDCRGLLWGLLFGGGVAGGILALDAWNVRDAAWFSPAATAIQAKLAGFGIDTRLKYFALAAFYSVCHSLLEEYYWRWFVFAELRRDRSLVSSIAVSSLGFMSHHVLVLGKFFGFASPAAWGLAACVAIGGAFWAWLYERTQSLRAPWCSHLAVDAAIFAVGFAVARDRLLPQP